MNPDEDKFDVPTVAKALGLSEDAVARLIANGHVHALRAVLAHPARQGVTVMASVGPELTAAVARLPARQPGHPGGPMLFEHWTPIYVLTKEYTTWLNLCDPCVAARIATKWSVKEVGERPGSLAPQRCTDCVAREQVAAG